MSLVPPENPFITGIDQYVWETHMESTSFSRDLLKLVDRRSSGQADGTPNTSLLLLAQFLSIQTLTRFTIEFQ